jgi:hypothetical protein
MHTQIIRPPAFQRPSGKLYLSAEQVNLVNSSLTLVELDTIPAAYKDGIENTSLHRITPGKAGFYCIVGQVYFWSCVADKSYFSLIRISGGAIVSDVSSHTGNQPGNAVTAKCSLPNQYLSKTDYVQLYAQSFAGVDTVDINPEESRTFLALQRVR